MGHADKHSGEVHRFLKLSTKRVIRSRDVRWLNTTFSAYMKSQNEENDALATVSSEDADDDDDDDDDDDGPTDDDDSEDDKDHGDDGDKGTAQAGPRTRSGRYAQANSTAPNSPAPPSMTATATRELRRLGGTWFNPEVDRILDDANAQAAAVDAQSGREDASADNEVNNDAANLNLKMIEHLFGDVALFARDTMLGPVETMLHSRDVDYNEAASKIKGMHICDAIDWINDETTKLSVDTKAQLLRELVGELKDMLPETYDEAWNHPDLKLRARWRVAIRKEIKSLAEIRKVWRKIKRSAMPKGRRCVKSKWVFDIKRSGLFKVRLVACGYSQIPGVDFTESYAPVINDVSWRILLVAKMLWGLDAKIVDVETAFLYGELEEEVYMMCKEIHDEDEVLFLQHSIYGLVQSARQYFKYFIEKLRKIGFKGGYPDPCLMTQQDENGIVFIAVWVDDSLLIGNMTAIDATIRDLKKEGFNLKIEGSLDD